MEATPNRTVILLVPATISQIIKERSDCLTGRYWKEIINDVLLGALNMIITAKEDKGNLIHYIVYCCLVEFGNHFSRMKLRI